MRCRLFVAVFLLVFAVAAFGQGKPQQPGAPTAASFQVQDSAGHFVGYYVGASVVCSSYCSDILVPLTSGAFARVAYFGAFEGSAGQLLAANSGLWYQSYDCTGTPYFDTIASLETQTFRRSASDTKFYYPSGSVLNNLTFHSINYVGIFGGDVCYGGQDATFPAQAVTGVVLDTTSFTPPFKLVRQ